MSLAMRRSSLCAQRELYVYSSTSLTLTMTDEDRAMLQRLRPGMSVRTLPPSPLYSRACLTSPLLLRVASRWFYSSLLQLSPSAEHCVGCCVPFGRA